MPGHKSDYLEFGVKVGLDSKEAQKELQELQKQLNSLGTLSNPKVGDKLSADMQKASQAAAQLKIALDSAIDVDTGKLDLSKFSRSLKDSGMKLKDYRDQLMSMGPEGEKAFTQVANSILKAEAPLRRTSKLIDTMWTTLKNTARWELSSSILHGLESSLQKAVTYAQDLNKSLTDIRIVTGYSTDHMAEFAIEANKAAKALSATTTEYTNASLIYFQQGLSDQQVKERTEVTVKMANVTRDSAQTVSDQMTAVWNNFADGSHTLEYYADVMTALGAATASSTKEISDGLEKFAAVAETVGLSYEYAASALATITSNTRQSADVVGTALKTLFARIQGLSLGETLEDGTDLNKYSEALAKVGISIKDSNGELKVMDDILNEMANVWDKLNNDQQVALAQTVAGVRQYTQLVALMENWDNGDEDSMMANLRTSANATGALQKQADIYAESWEAARDRVTAALESIFNKLLKDEFFIDTLNSIEKIITGIDKFIDSIGGLQGVLTGLGAVAAKVFAGQISSGLQNLAYNLNFKQAQEDDKIMRKKAASLTANMYASSNPALADSYEAIGKLQEKVIENSSRLSDEQLEALKYDIKRVEALQAQNAELEKQYQIISQQATNFESQDLIASKQHQLKEEDLQDLKTRYNYNKNVNEKYNNWKEKHPEYAGDEYKEERRKKRREIIDNELFDSISKAYQKDLADQASNRKQLKTLEDKKLKLTEKLNKIKNNENQTSEESKKKQEEINKEINKIDTEIDETRNNLEIINDSLNQTRADYQTITRLDDDQMAQREEAYQGKSSLNEDITKADDAVQEQVKNIEEKAAHPENFIKWSDSLIQAADGALSLSFGITQLSSAFDTLGNPDATGLEKFQAILMALAMGIPQVLSGVTSLGKGVGLLAIQLAGATGITKEMTKAELLNSVTTALNTAQKSGNTVATKVLGIAQMFLNGQIWAGVGALFAFLAPLLLVGAAIFGLVLAYNKWKESTPEEQLKKTKEETKALKEMTDQAEQSCQQLKDTILSYSDARTALEDLTQGTEEFKAKVEEANASARELIETLGLTYGTDYTINSQTGLIEVNEEKLKEKENAAEESVEAHRAAEYSSRNREKELENEIAYKNFIGETRTEEEKNTVGNPYAQGKVRTEAFGTLPVNSTISNTEFENYVEKTFAIIDKEMSGDIDKFLVSLTEGSEEFDKIKKDLFGTTELSESQQAFINKIKENTDSFSDLYDKVKANEAAIEANTRSLIQQSLENEKYYQDSEFKATIIAEAAKAYQEAYDAEKSRLEELDEEALYEEFAKIMGYTDTEEKNEDGERIFKNALGEEVSPSLDQIIAILSGMAGDEASESQGELTSEQMARLAQTNPELAAFVEWQNGGSQMSYTDQIALAENREKHIRFDNMAAYQAYRRYGGEAIEAYANFNTDEQFAAYNNLNPYADLEKAFNLSYEEKNGAKGPKLILDNAKEWWNNLSEEDKTLALNIKFDEGQWQEQLNALKAESVYVETAEQTGYSEEAVKSYTQMLMSQNEAYKNNEYLASIAAQQNLNFAKGQADAFDILNDYEDILKKANKESIEYHEALGKLNTALAQMFGAEFSYEFLTENLDTVKKALNGNEEAIQTLREEASKQILIDIGVDDKKAKKEISELYKLLDGKKIGDNLEKPFLDMFNNLIRALSLTKDQAESLLNSMGISATNWGEQNPIEPVMSLESVRKGKKWIQDEMGQLVEVPIEYAEENSMATETIETKDSASSSTTASGYMTLTPTEKDTGHTTVTYKVDSNITTTTEGESSMTLPKLEGAQIANTTSSISNGAKANKPADTGGGGGGSNAEPLEYEDEIERYHENTRQLERLTRALEKVSTAKDRAFGKHRLALIDDEIEATEALVQQQRALLAETREYLKQDFAEIQQYGFTTDQYGELTNYDEVMKQQIDKYNAAVATGNQDAIDAAKKQYDEFKENMEQYEETLTQYEEAQAQLQEYINQVVDLKLEKITTEVEIKILVNDKELTRLEYLLRKVEYEGKGAADAIGLMGRQFEQISEKAKPIQEAIDKIYEQARAEGRGLLEEEVKEIKSFYQDGVISSEEEKRIKEIYDKAASEDRTLTQAEEEQIQEYKEQLLELNEEVMDIVETIEGKFIETLEELNGKVDESIGRFATYTGMFQTLSDVITLSGKANSKYGMDMLNTLSARTVANASTAMRSNLRSYEALDQIYKEEQANLERAIKTGDERLIKQYQDRLHEVEMMRETSYESILTSWTEALQAANDLFDTKLTNMITSLKQNLGDIDKLVEIYDRAVELEDLYISGNKSIYELSKLARDVGKDIDKTANIIAKNKLVNLLDQINKMRAEGVKLSQYDLEYWQAKYELELAEIALQEAQEAKAQVKLTRNTAGGWGYTYVADAEAISEAQQNYEDSLYNMQELHDEYIRDYSERLIKNRQELVNALQDLDKTSLTFEEDALRLKEHHFKQEEYLIDELNKAYQRAGVSYQDTLLAQTYGGASLEDSHTNFINSVVKMIQDELLPGYQEFQESVDDINSQAGTTVEDAMDKIFESSMTMEDEVIKNIDNLTTGVKEVSDEIWNFQETYGEAISKMLADNEDYYSKTIKMYQNFMDKTEADKWLQYFDDMRGSGEVLGVAGSGATGAMAGNGSTAVTNSAFGDILQQAVGRNDRGNSSSKKTSGSNNRDNDTVYISPTGYVSTKVGIWEWSAYENNPEKLKKEYESQGYNVEKVDSVLEGINKDRNDKGVQEVGPGHEDYDRLKKLATGGYTGSWGSEGRLAILHEKELVLNKYDTENMLDMVNTLRDIDWRAKLSELWTNIEEHFIAPIFGGGDNLQQDVRIEASFPGVSNHTEIEEAFNNLINTASQYANRRRY